MVTLNYTFSKEDYTRYYQQVTLYSPGKRKAIIMAWLKRFAFFTAMLLLIKFSGREVTLDLYFFFSLFILFAIYIIPLFELPAIHRKNARAFIDDPLSHNFFTDYEVGISDTGISMKGGLTESKFQWGSIVKKEENDQHYYLFINSQQAIVLPKRSLSLPGDKQELERFFAQHLSFEAEIGHLLKD